MEWLDHTRGGRWWGNVDEDDENDDGVPGLLAASTSSSLESLAEPPAMVGVRGVSAFESVRGEGKDMLLSPLSDGGVAIFDLKRRRGWDVRFGEGMTGRMLGRSKPGWVSVETSSGRGSYLVGGNGKLGGGVCGVRKTVAPGAVVECVSVDPWTKRGWVAVEGRLIEIVL